jgi:hypothetical protein
LEKRERTLASTQQAGTRFSLKVMWEIVNQIRNNTIFILRIRKYPEQRILEKDLRDDVSSK